MKTLTVYFTSIYTKDIEVPNDFEGTSDVDKEFISEQVNTFEIGEHDVEWNLYDVTLDGVNVDIPM